MRSGSPVLLNSFSAHQGGTTSASFSRDGRTLVTGGYDCVLRLWDVGTWREIRSLPGHRRGHVAFSPDGRLLLSGGLHSDAIVYNTVDWQAVQTLDDTGAVWDLAFRPDGAEVVLIGPDDQDEERFHRALGFWDTRAWKRTGTADVGDENVCSVAFSPDGRIVALAHPSDGLVSIWSSDFGRRLAHFLAHLPAAFDVGFSPDGAILATVGADNSVRLWDTSSWHRRYEWRHKQTAEDAPSEHGVLCVAFSLDGKLLVSGCLEGMLSVWGLEGLF